MSPTQQFLSELEQEAATTRRLLERVPHDQLGWRPHARSMTLGRLALHVAEIPEAFARILTPDGVDFAKADFRASEPAADVDLPAALDGSVVAARAWLSQLDADRAAAIWRASLGGREILAAPRIALVRALMFNHWYHHRGQLSVYLRLLDVPVPSIYGPSADENPFG